jgi:regulator of protease activity HflC (stomatin/prohibitin superfamily)
MFDRIKTLVQALRDAFGGGLARVRRAGAQAMPEVRARAPRLLQRSLLVAGILGASYLVYRYPPYQGIGRGEVGVRTNQWTGATVEARDGMLLVLPGVHQLRRFSLLDQTYRPANSSKASGEAPFQSIEGLSLGVDLAVRYALDPARVATIARNLPEDIGGQVVEPAVQGTIYKTFTRYTVREIFSSKRSEIQQAIEAELKAKLAADGIVLRSVQIGQVDLPADYRAGMEKLLAEELETEKMRYTLELKEKLVKQTALESEAEKVRRERAAEAAAREQVIAAKAQEEAMRHVLPFKEKQIEQRRFEAEAEKTARIKSAEGLAQARRIEAEGEADSRRKLADAESYRQEQLGKVASAQLERDGALITKHPLLIQKAMADKLSDKISVIIAPPGSGGFIGSSLLGAQARTAAAAPANAEEGQQ